MQFGAATPRRLIDLNVIPREFRRRQFPVLTTGLAFVLVGSLLLLYGLFYLKSYADLEITAFRSRIASAQEAVQAASADEEAAKQAAQRYAGQRADYRVLAERQVRWSSILEAVSSPPAGVTVREISQAGYTVSILGSAPEFAQASAFLEALRATNLFSNSSIELIDSSLLTGTATPRASYGTPTATRPAGAVVPYLTPTAGYPMQLTPTPSRTPTPTYTPNAAATSTARVVQTATARAAETATARARPTATKTWTPTRVPTATRTPTRTPTATATPVSMVLHLAASDASEVGGTTSVSGNGPDKAVDGDRTTGWAPFPNVATATPGATQGRWLRIDLRNSASYTPSSDSIYSIKVVPYRLPLPGKSLPASSTGWYFAYAYAWDPASGWTMLPNLCDHSGVNWAQSQPDTCWSASAHGGQPLKKVAVIDIGIPDTGPDDSLWYQGIAEVIIEVTYHPGSAAASGPVGLGGADALGTATVTARPPAFGTPTPTRAVYPLVGTPAPTIPVVAIPTPRLTPFVSQIPTPGPIPPPAGQTSAQFLILLEVKPGEGYQ